MAKVHLNDVLKLFSGSLGGITFKVINGQIHATRKARPKKKKKWLRGGTPKQNAWRTRFHHATRFARAVKEDPASLAHYTALAKKHGKRLRDICLSDYFTTPQIEAVDLSGYTGKPGSRIRCRAFEKYPIAGVTVYLAGANGIYESGSATARGKTWTYTATQSMPAGAVKVQINANDHANQSAVHRVEWVRKDGGSEAQKG